MIVGSESGDEARPAQGAWFRRTRDQAAAAGVAFFLKQAKREDGLITIGKTSEVKRDLTVEVPELDGVQHMAYPTPRLAA